MERFWNTLNTALLLCLLMLVCGFASAAPKQYQVELIIFSHITPLALDSEQWPLLKNAISPHGNANAITLLPTPDKQTTFALLPQQDFLLKKEQNLLNKDADYHTLLHVAWRQPMYSPSNSQSVRLYGGKTYDNDGNASLENTNDARAYNSETNWQVNGSIKIGVQRFLNVDLNLLFVAPVDQLPDLSSDENYTKVTSNLVYFHLLEHRRMRSNELNYIDFPLYGVLIKIVPIESNPAGEGTTS